MSTIILNGSPKGKKGNSQIFCNEFVKGMEHPCEVWQIAAENPQKLVEYARGFDKILFVLPLYIHVMPGVMTRFLELWEPFPTESGKSMGFIVQSGFTEAAASRYAECYFASLARQMNCNYLGTVIKGGAAGTYMMPALMTRKLRKRLNALGMAYEETGTFDRGIMAKLSKPHELKGIYLAVIKLQERLGMNRIMWDSMLKKNNPAGKMFARPFAEEEQGKAV